MAVVPLPDGLPWSEAVVGMGAPGCTPQIELEPLENNKMTALRSC